jgi:transcription elongation factor GreA
MEKFLGKFGFIWESNFDRDMNLELCSDTTLNVRNFTESKLMRLPILDKLDAELQQTKTELKVEIPKALKTAMEHGDLSENAEFKSAKERQMFLETRLSQLQQRISDVMSLDINRIPRDRSGLGSTLILNDLNSGKEVQYHLVFPEEVNPDEGKISTASPVGRALLGKQEGDEITIPLPGQQKEFEVIRVITIHESNTSAEG